MAKRRWGRRLVGVLFLLLLVELSLQAAGPLVQRWMARRDAVPSPDAPLTILCVGDSNTYGLHMPQVYAYPALLESRLDPRFRKPITVINRGVPGYNTSQVLAALPQDLSAAHPDLVIVLCGINDAWNTSAEQRGLPGLFEQLKLVRLIRVLMSGVTTASPFEIGTDDKGEMFVDRGDGAQRVNAGSGGSSLRSGDALQAHVRTVLAGIMEHCADAGATPVLMTYAEFQGEFAGLNATIRELAASRTVLLVDNERAFGARYAAGDSYDALMLNDHHPNLRGYQLMAEAVDAVLTTAGWVPGADAALGSAATGRAAATLEPVATATLELLPGDILRLAGPPRAPFQVLMSHVPGEGEAIRFGDLYIPLAQDEVMTLSRLEPTFSGQLDGDGHADVRIPGRLRDAAGATGLRACVLLLRVPVAGTVPGDTPVRGVSNVVAVRG